MPAKDKSSLKRDHDLVEFTINTAEYFKKTVKNTKLLCTEFFRRLLITYNRCQTEAEQRLDAFPDHHAFVELLQKRYQEEEAKVQDIKDMDDQILKSEVDHSAIGIQLLEDQLRLSAAQDQGHKKPS